MESGKSRLPSRRTKKDQRPGFSNLERARKPTWRPPSASALGSAAQPEGSVTLFVRTLRWFLDGNFHGCRADSTIFPAVERQRHLGPALTGFVWDPHGVVELIASAPLRESHAGCKRLLPRFLGGILDVGNRVHGLRDKPLPSRVIEVGRRPFAESRRRDARP